MPIARPTETPSQSHMLSSSIYDQVSSSIRVGIYCSHYLFFNAHALWLAFMGVKSSRIGSYVGRGCNPQQLEFGIGRHRIDPLGCYLGPRYQSLLMAIEQHWWLVMNSSWATITYIYCIYLSHVGVFTLNQDTSNIAPLHHHWIPHYCRSTWCRDELHHDDHPLSQPLFTGGSTQEALRSACGPQLSVWCLGRRPKIKLQDGFETWVCWEIQWKTPCWLVISHWFSGVQTILTETHLAVLESWDLQIVFKSPWCSSISTIDSWQFWAWHILWAICQSNKQLIIARIMEYPAVC